MPSPRARGTGEGPPAIADLWSLTPSGDAVIAPRLAHILRAGFDRLNTHEQRHNGTAMVGVLAEVRSELFKMTSSAQHARGASPRRPEDVPTVPMVAASDTTDVVSTREAADLLGVCTRQARRLLTDHELATVRAGRLTARRADVEDLARHRKEGST